MKILLLQPPVQDFYDTNVRLQPLGLCMLKAAVKRHLPEVQISVRDYHHGAGKQTIPLPPDLSYLREYYSEHDLSPFSAFNQYTHFGAPFERIGLDLKQERPDLVGISALFSPYNREALACAEQVKTHLGIPVIMGGSHVSASPLQVLSDPAVDFIIRGEGERPLVEFLKTRLKGGAYEDVPNLGFKRGETPVLNPMGKNFHLDELPIPDFSDLPAGRYQYGRKPLCFLVTTRGCPHRCTFCSVHLTFAEGFRRRSPERVLDEIRERHQQGYRVFDFEDDNLTFHRQDFKKLLQGLIASWPPRALQLTAMNGISYLSLDGDLLSLMRRAGFKDLPISLVSADQGSLSRLRRPHTLAKYLEVVMLAHTLGFRIVSYQILGLPFETLAQMVDTMALMAGLPVLLGASIFYLTPGSPLAKEIPERSERDIFRARSTAMAVETDHFRREDLYTLFVTARIINFMKGLPLCGNEVSLEEALQVACDLGHRSKIGAELVAHLLREKRLYAATRQGLKPLPRFRWDLFSRVFRKAGLIRTRQGALIRLPSLG